MSHSGEPQSRGGRDVWDRDWWRGRQECFDGKWHACVWDGVCRCGLWFCEVSVCLAVFQELVGGRARSFRNPLLYCCGWPTHSQSHSEQHTHTHRVQQDDADWATACTILTGLFSSLFFFPLSSLHFFICFLFVLCLSSHLLYHLIFFHFCLLISFLSSNCLFIFSYHLFCFLFSFHLSLSSLLSTYLLLFSLTSSFLISSLLASFVFSSHLCFLFFHLISSLLFFFSHFISSLFVIFSLLSVFAFLN